MTGPTRRAPLVLRPWLLVSTALLLCLGGVFAARSLRGRTRTTPPAYEPPPRRTNPADGPNLLLVTLDTTRADRLGCYGNDLVGTPRLDAFAGTGVRFENAFCPMPETDPSHASMMTGLEASRHGVLKNGWRLLPEHRTLAEVLQRVGYTTYGAVSVEHLGPKTGFHQGFDIFDARFEGHQRDGGDTLALVKTWLDDVASRPFFLWVHWFDAHRDLRGKPLFYRPPRGFDPDEATVRRYEERSFTEEVARYDSQIRYLDALFGELTAELDRRGVLRNTVVAVVGDHGETLEELVGRFEYGYDHGDFLYDHQVRVPFLLGGPGVPAGVVYPAQVRGYDLFPTLLAALGCEGNLSEGLDGVDLLPRLRGQSTEEDLPVFLRASSKLPNAHDAAFRVGGKKLILSKGIGPEFFDLREDPRETRNLLSSGPQPPEAAAMRRSLEEWLARANRAKDQEIDPSLEASLRALGYLDASPERPR